MLSTRPARRRRPASDAAASASRAPRKVLLIGGSSEIGLAILGALPLGPGTEVLLAGRHPAQLSEAAGTLPGQVSALPYDASDPDGYQDLTAGAVKTGPVDLVISAVGVLTPQESMDAAPHLAGELIQANFGSHVTALLAIAARMREAGHGTIVILSSVAAIRPRRANFVYGAAKAGLDAFARGYADSLHGTGVRLLLVRPGFVTGRMTQGMKPAPLATTAEGVGAAVARALRGQGRGGGKSLVWVPAPLAGLATVMKLIPRPVWRKLES